MLLSPYSTILGTNRVPSSEAERCKIRHHISVLERHLAILDENTSQMVDSSNSLFYEREMCRQNLEAHKMLLSPARRMPVEIIRRIFLECLPDREANKSEPSTRSAPLLVSAICSGWRQVAIATPHLWNFIYLCFDDMLRSNSRGHVTHGIIKRLNYWQPAKRDATLDMQMMRLWISRADTVPVAIRLEYSIGSHNTTIPPTPEMIIDVLSGVRISNLIVGIRLTVQNCIDLLSCCSQIIRCSFTRVTCSPYMRAIDREPPILLPYLQSLWLWTDCDIGPLFNSLRLPCLTILSVEYVNRLVNDSWPQSEFAYLISRSSCLLQKLRLHQITMSYDMLIACLSCVASITELSIRDGAKCLNDTVLAAMTYQPHEGIPLIPRLEVIRFRGVAYSDQALVDMIKSRWRSSMIFTPATSQVSCLKTARVMMHTKGGDPWRNLQKFHKEGLDTLGSDVDVIHS